MALLIVAVLLGLAAWMIPYFMFLYLARLLERRIIDKEEETTK